VWSLNPFTDIRDNLNLSTGNPNLQPEFTDSYELTTIQTWEKASLFKIIKDYYISTIDQSELLDKLIDADKRGKLNIASLRDAIADLRDRNAL